MKEVFQLMRKPRLRLNLEKCAFRVSSGNFLGFLVCKRGIEMAPGQVEDIKKMQPPVIRK